MSFNIANGLAKTKSKKKRGSRKSAYDKQREEETIRNATQRGYLRRMTMEFLSDNIGASGCDLSTIGYLNVRDSQLSNLGVLYMCVSLRICILPGNYITEFGALENCVNLWAVDLHSNQIKKVPEHRFWASLTKLQIVLLHDNGISKLENIHRLSSSPSLLILTLYDTPLSLKRNYRHHVVNGVWSLKALDYHVVSDEEIIEDTEMDVKFSTMNKNLKINLEHGLKREFTYEDAVKHIEQFITRVNKIQTKFSPVTIIQKHWRGYLMRKRYKFIMDTRIWAATTIQRFYRFHKRTTKSRHDLLPPPSSPLATSRQGPADYEQYFEHGKENEIGNEIENDIGNDTIDVSDSIETGSKYSTIIGGNSVPLRTGHTQANHEMDSSMSRGTFECTSRLNVRKFSSGNVQNLEVLTSGKVVSGEEGLRGPENVGGGEMKRVKIKRRMTIDLVKLESTALDTIQSATCAIDINSRLRLESKMNALSKREKPTSKDSKTGIVVKRSRDRVIPREEDIEDLYKRRLKPEMVGKYRTVRVFLGPVLQAKSRQEVPSDDDDDSTTGFRLHGITPPRQKTEPMVEMLLSKREIGEDIRNALRQSINQRKQESRKQVVRRSHRLTNGQKLFLRTHGTMGLACLTAVHQAYGDRERAREQAEKMERVAEMKVQRDQIVGKLHTMRQDYQQNILRNRIREGVKIADALHENEKKQEEDHGKVAARRTDAVLQERVRQAQTTFVKEFASQQTLVSQASRAHDQAELKQEKLTKLVQVVRHKRDATLEQQALVKKYMEHRQLVRQTETANAKAELNAKMLQDANQKFTETETRAKRTENRLEQVKEFYPLPPVNAPAIETPLAIFSPGNFSPWEASLRRESRQCLSNSESRSPKALERLTL